MALSFLVVSQTQNAQSPVVVELQADDEDVGQVPDLL